MKTLIACSVVWFGCLSALPDDLSHLQQEQSKPYDRCMAQYAGSDHVSQCKVLK